MKIVVLDGYTLNPGDLSWDELSSLGDLTVYEYTSQDEIVSRVKEAEIVFTNKTPIDRYVINSLPSMKYIGVLATGYNVVDVRHAREKGITVTNIPTYGTASVAQMVFALLMELCHNVRRHSDAVIKGKWSQNRDFCFWDYPLIELEGKVMGIVGMGRIGRHTANIAKAFGMKVIAYDTYTDNSSDFEYVDLKTLFKISDVVSLHCPLTQHNKGMVNKEMLSMMKSTAFLINTSRGPLIVDEDLAEALNNNTIGGAALDVLSVEPPKADNPLLSAKNCIITPHIAWATKEARARLMSIAADNLACFINGNAVNTVE